MADKQILVVPAEHVNLTFVNSFYSGFDDQGALDKLLEHSLFMSRAEAEINPAFKQFIPYCVVKSNDRVFMYQRNKKGGENRLHSKYSIGVGGHVESTDGCDNRKCYFKGLARELKEELGIEKHQVWDEIVGFIYDDSNEVNSVHIGIVHAVKLWKPDQELHIEDTMCNWSFEKPETLGKSVADFETWSQIIIKEGIL